MIFELPPIHIVARGAGKSLIFFENFCDLIFKRFLVIRLGANHRYYVFTLEVIMLRRNY